MKESTKEGVDFGISSAIITTLGVMVGMNSSSNSKIIVIAAILVLAFADSLSDSFGIYFSEEDEKGTSTKSALVSMLAAFGTKFVFALSFLIPIIIFPNLGIGVTIALIYGAILLTVISFRMAKQRGEKPYRKIAFHLALATFVITASHFLGVFINSIFHIKS